MRRRPRSHRTTVGAYSPDPSSVASGATVPIESPVSEVHDADSEDISSIPTHPASLRPALFVLACVAVVTLGGFALALLGGGGTGSAVPGATRVPGVAIDASSAATVIARIASGGDPPTDVVRSVVVPAGAVVVGTSSSDAGVSQYDRTVDLAVGAPPIEVVRFYTVELRRARWSLLGTYPVSGGGTEVLAQRPSSDGYDWEIGVVVTPVTPAITPALAGGSETSSSSSMRLRLFQIPEGS